jgi:hypothetical protein
MLQYFEELTHFYWQRLAPEEQPVCRKKTSIDILPQRGNLFPLENIDFELRLPQYEK